MNFNSKTDLALPASRVTAVCVMSVGNVAASLGKTDILSSNNVASNIEAYSKKIFAHYYCFAFAM